MSCVVRERPANAPLITVMWLFTLPSLISLPFFGERLWMSAMLNFTSNVLAVILLFSPVRADRINGLLKLVVQVCFVCVTIALVFRNPALLEQILRLFLKPSAGP